VLAAVQQGRLTQKRIDQSVQRILAAKARVGLHRSKLVNLEKISDVIESQEMADAAQLAADRAVTLVKNEKNSVPLKSPKSTCVWVLAASRNGQGGRTFLEEIRQRSNEIRTTPLDPLMSQIEIDAALAKTSDCETQVVAAFVSTGAYKGAASLGGNYPALMEALGKGPAPVVLIALGSPYLLRAFPEVSSFMATFSPVQTSEIAAVKALLGEMPITGTLPVTIPGLAKIGDGIMIGSPQPVNTQAR
jgi:beta-N-acetylhexosaminidase